MKSICFPALIILIITSSCSVSDSSIEKPNIIFLLSDDQRDNTFSAMGHPVILTPGIDKLISSGVRFSNTYIAEPTCSPSRVAIFTGTHERINGVGFTSSYQLTEEQWANSYPELLRESGYFTGFIGKFGLEYYTFKGRAKEKFDFWRAHDGWARFWPKNAENCFEYYDSEEEIITPIMGESIERFLQKAPPEKPFCLSVSFSVPHGSQITSMYPDNEESRACMIPANENLKLGGHPYYDHLYRDIPLEIPKETATDPYVFIPESIMDQNQGRKNVVYPYDYDINSCTEHHIRYYQQISGMDKIIGDMVKSLEKRGLSENTIIIFASDHGLLMGDYGMGGKGLLYDLASKIPCFIYDPHLPDAAKGTTIENLVSSLDITSTILDYAGITPPDEMQGHSLIPLINNKNEPWRDELFLENLYTGRNTPFSEGLRSGKWKYIRMYNAVDPYNEKDLDFSNRAPDFEQLFDLEEDPGEKNNLIDIFEGNEILDELREKTARHSSQMNDTRDKYVGRYMTVPRNN